MGPIKSDYNKRLVTLNRDYIKQLSLYCQQIDFQHSQDLFGVVDYCVLALMLIISSLVTIYLLPFAYSLGRFFNPF